MYQRVTVIPKPSSLIYACGYSFDLVEVQHSIFELGLGFSQ